MSFKFDWQNFANEEQFLSRVKGLLTNALNKKKPPIIVDTITVQELEWGSESPSLEILEVGDLASDRFRGIFKLNYSGSARITLATKVQANLLNVYAAAAPKFTMPDFVSAQSSFSIPLNLTLSDFVLSGIVILVFSKAKGLTLVFRNDPLQSIRVSSTFDHVPAIASFLQSQIETHMRTLFREVLPALLYALSLQWTPNQFEHHLLPENRSEPVKFVDIDEEKHFSLVNILRLEAMSQSRHTLAISPLKIPTAIYRAELYRRQCRDNERPVGLLGDAMYDHVHDQATRIASHSNHKPKRRVIKIQKPAAEKPSPVSYFPVVTTPPQRPTSAPPVVSDEVATLGDPIDIKSELTPTKPATPKKAVLPAATQSSPTKQTREQLVKETKALIYSLKRHERKLAKPDQKSPVIYPVEEGPEDLPPAYVA
ncbi:Mitochondrial distribution and morphology protein 34 [Wickerhamiella sorbophila]|uniref:Mitochondrial distribution and morphology protein 34 n=1 Tax=Wickerhamiella sorbophila TaxID=45607 RepID=A0A2T0FPF3_9ASCO|nr:Mitochondrial distribution and morphology protein 34 [Wickerhamiella sorbophila]PRT56873.1 Mitochondrial distribution and morphology protein 34 [Wickerhamiella sorbophila]